MKTWSIEALLMDARDAVRGMAAAACAPLLDAVFPVLTHDRDTVVDGAEALQDAEEEDEYLDPHDFPIIRTRPWGTGIDDVPNPTEPGLTDDELVAVRGLIQERYERAVNVTVENVAAATAVACGVDPDEVVAAIRRKPKPVWSDLADASVEHKGHLRSSVGGPPTESPEVGEGSTPHEPPTSGRSGFTAGYRAAIQLAEEKAKGDRRLADALGDRSGDLPEKLRHSGQVLEDFARYMRAIEPKEAEKK